MTATEQARRGKPRGLTPHSVAVRAKIHSWKPPDHLTRERRKVEAERENFVGFSKYQQSCDLKNSWIRSSYRHYVRCTAEREAKSAFNKSDLSIEERRERLRIMLETEEEQFLEATTAREETILDRQAILRERAKALREKNEAKRQQMVSEKMEQLFINQCEELRPVLAKRREEEVRLGWVAQAQSKQEQQLEEQKKDRQFAEMCEANRQREEQKESERAERQQQSTNEHLKQLRAQMDGLELQRQQAKALREEEAQLLREHQEMLRLQEQREKHQSLTAQQTKRKMLDENYRMKMKRLAKEQQEELALDMRILQQVNNQESNEKSGAAQRKIELREEQQRQREYLAAELDRQKQLEQEAEQLFEEKLQEMWAKREKQSQIERDARNRLMEDVLATRSMQIQHNLELNKQKQDELDREREELVQTTEESKLSDEEEKRRHKELSRAYQADLQAQIQKKWHLKQNEKALEEWEFKYGLAMQQEYERMKERILSRLTSHDAELNSFRRTDWAESALSQQLNRENGSLNH